MNYRHPYAYSGLLAVVLITLGSITVRAQTLQPFASHGGYPTAAASAKTALGSDAILIFVGTFGNLTYLGQEITFSTTDGRATLWGYTFYSPSTMQRKTIGVVRPLGTFTPINLPDSLNGGLAQNPKQLDSAAPYFSSKDMVTKLPGDTAYARYRTQYPTVRPTVITLSDVVADSVAVPVGFPLDKPIWSLIWSGEGDSTMVCVVASVTGDAYCQRIELPSGVVSHDALVGTASLSVAPNPATGRTRVAVDIPTGMSLMRGVGLGLYNERGQMVMSLTESFIENDYHFAEFDATELPAGNYFCRAIGPGWNGVTGVAVTH